MGGQRNEEMENVLLASIKARNEGLTLIPPVTVLTSNASSIDIDLRGVQDDMFHHFYLCGILRTTATATADTILITVNNDTGPNYHYARWVFSDATTSAIARANISYMGIIQCDAGSSTPNAYSSFTMDVPVFAHDYKKLSFFATSMRIGTTASNTQIAGIQGMGCWTGTVAIEQLTFRPNSGSNFVAGCRIYTYGIK